MIFFIKMGGSTSFVRFIPEGLLCTSFLYGNDALHVIRAKSTFTIKMKSKLDMMTTFTVA